MVVLYFSCHFEVVVQRCDPCLPMLPSWSTFFISAWSFFFLSFLSFFIWLSILIIIILTSTSDKLLASISFSSFSGRFYCSFIWGLFLSLHILSVFLYLFLCVRLIHKESGSAPCQTLCVTGSGLSVGAISNPHLLASSARPGVAEKAKLHSQAGFYHCQAWGRVS